MKNILRILNPFFKLGSIFGLIPFKFSHDGKIQIVKFRALHSALMGVFWNLVYFGLASQTVDIKVQGSELSKVSSIAAMFVIVFMTSVIIILNFVNAKCYEDLIWDLWSVDVKV